MDIDVLLEELLRYQTTTDCIDCRYRTVGNLTVHELSERMRGFKHKKAQKI